MCLLGKYIKAVVYILGKICPRFVPDIAHMRYYWGPLKLKYKEHLGYLTVVKNNFPLILHPSPRPIMVNLVRRGTYFTHGAPHIYKYNKSIIEIHCTLHEYHSEINSVYYRCTIYSFLETISLQNCVECLFNT